MLNRALPLALCLSIVGAGAALASTVSLEDDMAPIRGLIGQKVSAINQARTNGTLTYDSLANVHADAAAMLSKATSDAAELERRISVLEGDASPAAQEELARLNSESGYSAYEMEAARILQRLALVDMSNM